MAAISCFLWPVLDGDLQQLQVLTISGTLTVMVCVLTLTHKLAKNGGLLHGLSRALLISPIPPFIQKTFILTAPTWTSGILKQSFYSLDLDCELSPLMQIENVAQCGIES